MAAIIDEKIFCCHGGLGPDLQSMEQIRRIMRPTDVPDQGLLCDLLWSDPDKVSLWAKYVSELANLITISPFCFCRTRQAGVKMIEVYRIPLDKKLWLNFYKNTILI